MSNSLVLAQNLKDLYKLRESIQKQYANRTQGDIYHRRMAQVDDRIEHVKNQIVATIYPGGVNKWEIQTLEGNFEVVYPANYSKIEVSRTLELEKLLLGKNYSILNIILLGSISLGRRERGPIEFN